MGFHDGVELTSEDVEGCRIGFLRARAGKLRQAIRTSVLRERASLWHVKHRRAHWMPQGQSCTIDQLSNREPTSVGFIVSGVVT